MCTNSQPTQANVHHVHQAAPRLCPSSWNHDLEASRRLSSCRQSIVSLCGVGCHHVHLHRTHVLWPFQLAPSLCKLCHGDVSCLPSQGIWRQAPICCLGHFPTPIKHPSPLPSNLARPLCYNRTGLISKWSSIFKYNACLNYKNNMCLL